MIIDMVESEKRIYDIDPKIVQHKNRRDIRITKAKVFNYNEALDTISSKLKTLIK
jgi:hypothetical protein